MCVCHTYTCIQTNKHTFAHLQQGSSSSSCKYIHTYTHTHVRTFAARIKFFPLQIHTYIHTYTRSHICSKDQVLSPASGETEQNEVPVTLLWVLVYLSQHFDKKRLHAKGLEYIEEVICVCVCTCTCTCIIYIYIYIYICIIYIERLCTCRNTLTKRGYMLRASNISKR